LREGRVFLKNIAGQWRGFNRHPQNRPLAAAQSGAGEAGWHPAEAAAARLCRTLKTTIRARFRLPANIAERSDLAL
jgi:hypothetical protein